MRRLARLTEDFAEWDTGVWIHYSKEPFLKVNPRQLHQDPAGIYFFPEKFDAKGQWRLFPYKFRVAVERLNVLDLSKLSGEDAADLYEKVVPEGARKLSRGDFVAPSKYHHSPDPANTLWDALREHFVLGKGRTGGQAGFGAWNRALRNAGYDAVFDDTGAIHSVEVQLLVLDPTKADVIERVDQRSSGFDEMGEVTKALAELLAPYGTVKVEEPRRRRGMWSSSSTKLSASVHVEKADDPDTYAKWGVEPVFSGGDATPSSKDTVPREIRVYLEYSSPSLGYGAGAAVETGRRDLDMGEMRRNVKRDMDAVWEKAKERVPEPLAASVEFPAGRRLAWLAEADVPIAKVYPRPTTHGEPPEVSEFPLGTWAKDGEGVRWQLRALRLDDPRLVFPEGTAISQLARDYAKWIERGSPAPPIFVAEDPKGKLVVVDGHQRGAAMRLMGVQDTRAWVAPSEYWDAVTGGEEFGEGRRLRGLAEAVAALPKNPFPSSVVKEPVYHGTKQRFGRFEFRKGVVSVLGQEFAADRHAFFFTASKEEAATFGPTVLTAYVDLRNPLVSPDRDPDAEDLAYILAPLVEVGKDGRAWLSMVTGAQVIGWDAAHAEEGESYAEHPGRWVYLAYTDRGLAWDVLDNAECVKRMKARGYDGSFVDEGRSATYGEGQSVAVFAPGQVEIVGHEDGGVG